MSFSDQQLAVINSNSKRLMVLAGAGAGKSHTMVGKVKRFIDEGIEAKNIAVITFTNEATDSLLEKLDKLKVDTDGLTTKTLHSFCYKLVKTIYSFTNKPMPKIMASHDAFLGQFWKLVGVYDKKDDTKYATSRMPHKSWKNYYELINIWNLAKYTPEKLIADTFNCTAKDFRLKFLNKEYGKGDREAWNYLMYLEYETWKRTTRQMDFNDCLLFAIRELSKADERTLRYMKSRYKVIIVDEMQDTNTLVVDVLNLLTTPDTTIIMVGDIRQSIYSFINASPKVILGYTAANNFESLSLNYNYRSSTEIVDNGNHFVSHYPSFNLGGDTIPTKPENGHPVYSMISGNEIEEIDMVTMKIEELLKEGYKHKDICIMYRTNAQALMILDWCISSDIPFCIKKDSASIFDRSEMKDILAYLKIINETDSTKLDDWKKIANKPSRFIPNAAFAESTSYSLGEVGFGTEFLRKYHSHEKIREFSQDMGKHIHNCKKLTFGQQVDYVMDVIGYAKWWDESDDKDRFFDLKVYVNALKKLACDHKTYRGLIKHINDVKKAIKEKNTEDGITFTTIHSSKGLEWKVCIVIGICKRLYPFYRAVEENGQDGYDEEARLFYVASTRPIERLYYSEINGDYGNFKAFPSPFVLQTERVIIEDNGERYERPISYFTEEEKQTFLKNLSSVRSYDDGAGRQTAQYGGSRQNRW